MTSLLRKPALGSALFFGIWSLMSLAMATPAHAISGIGISPPRIDISLLPGEKTSGQLTVINDGDSAMGYTVYATDYSVSGENYKGIFNNSGKGPNLSAITWFGLPKGVQTLAGGKEATLDYTISVPKTAAIGGHYATVFVQTLPPTGSGTYIARIQRVGAIFYMGVGGNLKPQGHVVDLSVPWLQAVSPITGYLRVQNTGNVHFLVSGSAQLYTLFGKVGTPTAILGEVLPSTTRRFPISVSASSPIELYQMRLAVTFDGQTEHLSRWTLLVPTITLVIVCASLVLVVAAIVWAFVRRRRRKRSNPPQL
jgi:hypothetical protein